MVFLLRLRGLHASFGEDMIVMGYASFECACYDCELGAYVVQFLAAREGVGTQDPIASSLQTSTIL